MNRQSSINKITNSSSSPTKKFRTTFNNSQSAFITQKSLPSFHAYLKQYPLDVGQDVLEILKLIQPLQNDFSENLKALKLYKQQLGSIIEQNWCDFLAYLKNIIIRMNKRTQKLLGQKQSKISQLLEVIKKMQIQRIQSSNKIQKISNLRQLQNNQLIMANNQLDIVNRQMRNIYKILQSDMKQVMQYLTTLQLKKQKQDQLISNQMNSSINNLSILLDSVQKQQKQTGNTLGTMKEMIKAMTKSVKVSVGTQVEESQLEINVEKIFSQKDKNVKVGFEIADGMSVNIDSVNKVQGVIDNMKSKEKQLPTQDYDIKKSVQKPWSLTPAILVFLQNMSKQNQIGRILPYQYVKQFITDIYDQRVNYDTQISTSIIGNSMSFDEFMIYYFLKKHKIRRLAEVKLLQMIISLKYYAKFWTKVEIFCNLLNIIRYVSYSDPNDSPAYKFDHYAQSFFFTIYKQLRRFKVHNDEEGSVYIKADDIKKFMKVALFFTDQISKSRIQVKMQKTLRIFIDVQYYDLDHCFLLILDEFFAMRKKNLTNITKTFSKAYQKNKGYFSLGQIIQVFDCMNSLYKKCLDPNQLYPIQSQLWIGKLYIYAITSGKNNYEIILNNFINSVQKFGFDIPYPFIKNFNNKKKNQKEQPMIKIAEGQANVTESKNVNIQNKQEAVNSKANKNNITNQIKNQNIVKANFPSQNLNAIRIDVASKLFSQHFSIMKELLDYVTIFSQTLSSQKNPQILWKSFNQIKVILQRGCQFLKFPLVKQMVK